MILNLLHIIQFDASAKLLKSVALRNQTPNSNSDTHILKKNQLTNKIPPQYSISPS